MSSINCKGKRGTIVAIACAILALVVLAIILVVLFTGYYSCDSVSKDAINHLSTKTPYRTNEIEAADLPCEPKKIWILSRHGTRFPDDDEILQMQNELPQLQAQILANEGSRLCEQDLNNLKEWKPYPGLNVSKEDWLTDEGERELGGIGQRFKERFPNLFPGQFSPSFYSFRTTAKQRTIESGRAFVQAIFPGRTVSGYFPQPVKKDPLLDMYKICAKYLKDVKENPASHIEAEKFTNSTVYKEMVERVSSRLGVKDLSVAQVLLMYKTCSFETAWTPDYTSPWCSAFDMDDFQVHEYFEDIEEFHESGYAYPINYEQACPLLVDATNALTNGSAPTTTAYFAHSGSIAKLYSRLGLFNDTVMLGSDNFEELKDSRQWRSSRIGKFASNIAFVLLDCAASGEGQKIAVLVQENLVELPGCGSTVCDFDKFLRLYRRITSNCNFDRICQV